MSQTITGYFDGKVIIPEKPVKLPVGKRLRMEVTIVAPRKNAKNGKKIDRQGQFIGTGMFESGIPDLGSNKKHLEGLGRK